jgi:hypothetical protein
MSTQTTNANLSSRQSKSSRRLVRWAEIIGIALVALAAIFVSVFYFISGMPPYAACHTQAAGPVTSSVDLFQYHPERIQTGTVYHYVKSNIDGSKPAKVSLYVASPERIEAFKIYPGAAATALVIADMDWTKFTPRNMESYDVHADGSRSLVVKGQLGADDRYQFLFANILWVKNKPSSSAVGHYPVHNYNFDLASLNFAFRHLIDPTRDVQIGVQMPCFDMAHLGEIEYLGTASLHYVGEEACHSGVCRKYTIGGEAFGSHPGTLWVNKDGGYFEKVEIPMRDNPSWKDFKLELTGIDQMSADAWEKFITSETAAYFAKSG